jgi:hypothetical protein
MQRYDIAGIVISLSLMHQQCTIEMHAIWYNIDVRWCLRCCLSLTHIHQQCTISCIDAM